MAQISCNNVSIGYDRRLAVEDISFDVRSGDYICIVGENGSGKSTLMKGILGLLPLKSGVIAFGDGVKQNKVGYLPQQTIVQRDFPASVFEVVLSGCLNSRGMKPFYSVREKKTALENMEQLGIEELKNKSYKALSGGQQQRVLLARALCAAETLLVLDEPVTGLDPIATADLYALIEKLNKEKGVTVLMVSHDVYSAVEHADKILHINGGMEFFGTTADYKNSAPGVRFLRKKQNPSVGGGRHD
jgi:zinc transport system ATP-binding protein